MKIKIRLKNLLDAAKLYESQGLLIEASEKYEDAISLIQKTEPKKEGQNLIDMISKKLSAVKNDIEEIAKQPTLPEVSKKNQDLIKKLFADSKSKDTLETAHDEAITLAKFGQFERAFEELNELLKNASIQIDAAKSILRCHMARTSIDDAVTQFQEWQSGDLFAENQLATIRLFLEVFRYDNKKEVISLQLRNPEDVEELKIQNGKYPDICSMIITLDTGPLEGVIFVLDISFQTGDIITLFIEGHKEELIENFEVGKTLNNVQFNSTIATFKGKGIVTEKIMIDSGSRMGDYRLDIRISSS